MRRFKVKINEQVFEVEVEEMGDGGQKAAPAPRIASVAPRSVPVSAPIARTPVAPVAPVPQRSSGPAPAPKSDGGGGGDVVRAPIPGVVSEIRVAVGKEVKRGEVLLMLEAMKMQNEIPAPFDAVVAEIKVSQGATVQSGDVLLRLER